MNNNSKNQIIPIILKRPSLRTLEDLPERRRPVINVPIINPFAMWRDSFASTKESAFLQGLMRGMKIANKKAPKDTLASPVENPLGDFNDNLVETLKEAFVLGFIQGINRNN